MLIFSLPQKYCKQFVLGLLVLLTINIQITGEGFSAGTLVKTSYGYVPIEELQVDDQVVCYNFKGECVEQPVLNTIKQTASGYYKLSIDDTVITVASDHKFYLPQENDWIETRYLTTEHVLLKSCNQTVQINDIEFVEEPVELYDITVKSYHNFCVSQEEILAHNLAIIIPVLTWKFGADIALVSLATLAKAVGAGIISYIVGKSGKEIVGDFDFRYERDMVEHESYTLTYPIYTQDPQANGCRLPRVEQTPWIIGHPLETPQLPEPMIYPRLTPEKPFAYLTPLAPINIDIRQQIIFKNNNQYKNRPNSLPSVSPQPRPTTRQRMTTKEATELAKSMGFERSFDHKFDPHGEAVFKKGNVYITQDRDGHRGGIWKVYEGKERLGTYNEDLKEKLGK